MFFRSEQTRSRASRRPWILLNAWEVRHANDIAKKERKSQKPRSLRYISPSANESCLPTLNMTTWLIVGATHGIGLEYVRQLLQRGDRVLATINEVTTASQLWTLAGASPTAACRLLQCDATKEESILVGNAAPASHAHSDH